MSPIKPGQPFEHGNSAYYNGICKCPTCRAAGTAYAREYRARRRQQGHPSKREIKHGTYAAFKYDHCHCEDCSWAKTKHDVAYRERKRERRATQKGNTIASWHTIKPEDAAGINLHERSDIIGPVNEDGEECPWPWEPQTLTGTPMGQYHCPYCGAMVIAGVPHTDYSEPDE